ncbi:MAG: four helix bundle protein [Nitrospinota bacterium]
MEKKEYGGFRDLKVYQLAYKLVLEIFEISKSFPKEEKYSLIDQIRRSSRSVATNIAEAWEKRRYPKSFISKLIDSASEKSETLVWLVFSLDHNYILKEKHHYLSGQYLDIGRMLNSMIDSPDKFCH